MGIKRLTYRDIPAALRAKAAAEANRRLQATLSDPAASREQREVARQQQTVVHQWATGTLPADIEAPGSTSRSEHTVVVVEDLQIREDD